MKALKWINRNLEEAVMVALLIIMAITMGCQVCARYVFNYSISWTEELTRYLFVWSGFISISLSIEKAIAIRLDHITMNMKPKVKSTIFIIDYLIELIFFAYLIPTACRSMYKVWLTGRLSTALGMPMVILYAAPVIGFLLAEIRLIQKIYFECKKLKEG